MTITIATIADKYQQPIDGNVTLDEFKTTCAEEYIKSYKWVSKINAMDEDARIITLAGLKEGYLNERYIYIKDNLLEIDINIMHLDILNFKIRNKIYQNRLALKVEMVNNGINVVSNRRDYYSDKLAENKDAKISPKDICREYDALAKSNKFGNNIERMKLIAKE